MVVMDFINGAESHRNDFRSNDIKKMPWDDAKLGNNKYINDSPKPICFN